ncbi:TcpQ domain-containing protein [Vibrio harveyi]|uniref:TcpQ domain-containing protein n=1 Tax=Vibrio harveyi TaxID=669 RepID=UPI00247FB2BC|nr:TcpQ domain-containing protein [Vibrio harveyi]
MKKIEIPRRAALSVVATLVSASAVSGVYVSVDSIQPTTDHQIKLAEIQAAAAHTDALVRATQSSEFMMGQLIEWQKAQQRRTDNKWEQTMQQRLVNDLKQEDILKQQNHLISERKNLELDRIAMVDSYEQKSAELNRRNAETMKTFYDERRTISKEFYDQQSNIQKQTLTLQQQVATSSDDLLAAQLKLNAPSNVVVASKDASNFTASVKPTDINTIGALSKTNTKTPLVNMNSFIESIMPKGWRYTPPANSSNKAISLVQGKDWKSIVNQIALQHPYIQFHIDPYKKQLVASQMYEPNSPKANSNVVRAWHISPSRSLRETIEHFGAQANWRVIWDTQDIDYPIVAPAVVTTDFAGKAGIVNRLMKSTQSEDFPLFADWKKQNRVVVIKRRGSTQK